MFVLGLYATFFAPRNPHVSLAFFQFAIPAIAALAGGFANKSSKSSSDTTTTTTPGGGGNPLRDQIVQAYMSQIQNPMDFSGYAASGISNINKNAQAAKKKTAESLSARGISGPALDFALTRVDNQRFSDVTNFQNELPLMKQNLQNQILQNAGAYLSTNPFGTTSVGKGTQTQPGNVAGGVLGNAANTLAYLYGQGAYKQQG